MVSNLISRISDVAGLAIDNGATVAKGTTVPVVDLRTDLPTCTVPYRVIGPDIPDRSFPRSGELCGSLQDLNRHIKEVAHAALRLDEVRP
jgi:hypothetical protein